MWGILLRGVLLSSLFTFGLAVGAAQASEILYGITFDFGVAPAEMLITIDTTTGAGTPVGPLSSPMAAYGLGTRAGKLYAFDQVADRIRELDPATGATVDTIDIGLALVGEGALAFRGDGIGFLEDCFEGDVYSFDITGPSSALIGSHGPAVCMDGLDFSPSGSPFTLFGLSQETSALYTINEADGSATLVGDTGLDDDGLSGLAFRADGVLFGEIGSSLYTINVLTGAATLVGPIGFVISGLTFLDVAQVPEPSAALLLSLGLIGVLVAQRQIRPAPI